MSTLEQQARDLLERMEVPNAPSMTAGELVELANLMGARNAALEEAAKLCDEMARMFSYNKSDLETVMALRYASEAIRIRKNGNPAIGAGLRAKRE